MYPNYMENNRLSCVSINILKLGALNYQDNLQVNVLQEVMKANQVIFRFSLVVFFISWPSRTSCMNLTCIRGLTVSLKLKRCIEARVLHCPVSVAGN